MTVSQLEVDQKQLDDVGSVASNAVPSPAAGKHLSRRKRSITIDRSWLPSVGAIPVGSIAGPTLPLPATMTWSFDIRVS